MATVKEIKAELDTLGIKYPSKSSRAYLAALLFTPGAFDEQATPEQPEHEDRPRDIKGIKPDYIEPGDDFVDPNAQRPSQAE